MTDNHPTFAELLMPIPKAQVESQPSGNHPITPPPELVQEWARYQGFESPEVLWRQIATEAARWGADQELEACLVEVSFFGSRVLADKIRAARRPESPSLKAQALAALQEAAYMADDSPPQGICSDQIDIIRRALEALDD